LRFASALAQTDHLYMASGPNKPSDSV